MAIKNERTSSDISYTGQHTTKQKFEIEIQAYLYIVNLERCEYLWKKLEFQNNQE